MVKNMTTVFHTFAIGWEILKAVTNTFSGQSNYPGFTLVMVAH